MPFAAGAVGGCCRDLSQAPFLRHIQRSSSDWSGGLPVALEPARRGAGLFWKAVALQLFRRFDEAEALYERILAIEPKSEEALGNLIAINTEAFDLARVHRYALRLVGLCPQSTVALQALTLVAVERRDYETAAHYFADLLEHAPEGTLSHSHEGDESDEIEYVLSGDAVAQLSKFGRLTPYTLQTPQVRS
jgi:tetratricopeptide (TPR) repeat protein